ncbi:alpha/beta hydrolase [Cytobacillus oceanisediminis]|uniref:alpha/beta hydrolase n=1 Tax=Cytobacillus oceanisediminis TaxID=665099 RepID=UPI00207B0DCD|nr:alpha/beta hydrolase [Cytobacillus oceanisediminis]USK44103.1 alpha/beta fold hydrolase [Cytobacillus oceanisediminis]
MNTNYSQLISDQINSNPNNKESLFQLSVEGENILGIHHQAATKDKLIIFCGGINAQRCDLNRIGVKFSRAMASKGISVIRFDYRGLGVSEGFSWNMTIESKIKDIKAIVNYAINTLQFKEIYLLGFSDGARNIVGLASDYPEVKGLVLWNPALIYNQVNNGENKPILDKKTKKILWTVNGNYLSSEFYRSVQRAENRVLDEWYSLNKPVLIIWGEKDVTTITTREKLKDNFKDSVTQKTVLDGRHLFCKKKDHLFLIEETFNWLSNIS